MRNKKQIFMGIDFGGTFVKMALVNRQGKILARKRHSTAETTDREAWLDAVTEGFQAMLTEIHCKEERVAGVGVGVPGFVDFESGYIHELTNVPGWTAVPLASLLRKRFGMRAFVDNDVNAMALGEIHFGAGKQFEHAVFITLGTGVGGGIVINRKLFRGAHSMAGEIGHLSIAKNGIRSPQGAGGLELYIGNRQIAKRAVRELNRGRKSKLLDLCHGQLDEITPREIAEAAADGDLLSLEIFDFVADCLATALASVTYLIQPEAFIIGGGVAASGKVLFNPLEQHLRERLSPHFAKRIEIRRARLGNDAGVIGSAALAM